MDFYLAQTRCVAMLFTSLQLPKGMVCRTTATLFVLAWVFARHDDACHSQRVLIDYTLARQEEYSTSYLSMNVGGDSSAAYCLALFSFLAAKW